MPTNLTASPPGDPFHESDELVCIDKACGGWTTRRNLPHYLAARKEHAARRAAGIPPTGPASRY